MSTFNMIIRSNNRINFADTNSNACTIKMNCSTHSRYIKITVKNVFISRLSTETFTNIIADFRAGFSFCNSYDTNYDSLRSIGFTDLTSSNTCQSGMTFIIENPANRNIDFSLYNEANTILQSSAGNYNSPWFITLECEPLNEI